MTTAVQGSELESVVRENIVARRKSLGMSQKALAEKMGLEQPYISDVERGIRNPMLDTIARFADALKTTPRDLLTPEKFSEPA